jgi:hypothetical protein
MTKSKMGAKQAPTLNIADPQVLELWVRAGGMCEFHGCNDYLLQDRLTTNRAKLADIAHIVARSIDGPRGDDPLPILQRNRIENIFLACTKHHRLIDNKNLVNKFPKELLLRYKQEHEERIKYITSLTNENETTVIRLIGNIRRNTISVSNEEIRDAVLQSSMHYPRYLGAEHHIEIDLTSLLENNLKQYWTDGIDKIKDVVERHLVPAIQKNEIRHLSIFAFARIPFLVYLGYAIGDKIPIEIFQKHRDGKESWLWLKHQKDSNFLFKKEQEGLDKSDVAVVISLSGQISVDELPKNISRNFTIYSLVPQDTKPNRTILSSKGSLQNFRNSYAGLLREIEANHPQVREIHVFPAVPISAAITLGREVLRNVSPALVIYDRTADQFEKAIKL